MLYYIKKGALAALASCECATSVEPSNIPDGLSDLLRDQEALQFTGYVALLSRMSHPTLSAGRWAFVLECHLYEDLISGNPPQVDATEFKASLQDKLNAIRFEDQARPVPFQFWVTEVHIPPPLVYALM
jgi:hypothetical protein